MSKIKSAAPGPAQGEEQIQYPKEELLANVEALFNVKKEVLLAAMHGDRREEYTVDEAQALIKDFMKRKVI